MGLFSFSSTVRKPIKPPRWSVHLFPPAQLFAGLLLPLIFLAVGPMEQTEPGAEADTELYLIFGLVPAGLLILWAIIYGIMRLVVQAWVRTWTNMVYALSWCLLANILMGVMLMDHHHRGILLTIQAVLILANLVYVVWFYRSIGPRLALFDRDGAADDDAG